MVLNAFTKTNTVQSYQSNLVVSVETIHVALMDHKLKKCSTRVDMNRLKLPCLKAASFVIVQRKKPKFSELYLA